MARGRCAALLAAATLTCAGLVGTAGPATAAPTPAAETPATVTVITTGLNGPRQLSEYGNRLYVAESDTGQVSRVAERAGSTAYAVVKNVAAAQGVVRSGGKIYVASGAADPEGDNAPTGPSTRLFVAKPFGKPHTFADLLKYELKYNPDNQRQFGADGQPEDALSNPYYVIKRRSSNGFLVADAGANDVLAVNKKGKVSTFFVPPAVTTGGCADLTDQNSDAGPSCDAVPTGLAYGPGGNLYVSALTSEVEGQGRVYVVDRNGKLVKTLTGFSGPTGIAVDPSGNVYVSELLQGLPMDDSAAASVARSATPTRSALARAEDDGPDLTSIGQIVKVAPDGTRTYAQVTMPSGLLWNGGKLYASAYAVAGLFANLPNAGEIVSVDPSSFLAQ